MEWVPGFPSVFTFLMTFIYWDGYCQCWESIFLVIYDPVIFANNRFSKVQSTPANPLLSIVRQLITYSVTVNHVSALDVPLERKYSSLTAISQYVVFSVLFYYNVKTRILCQLKE
jgi:hypothetical protein